MQSATSVEPPQPGRIKSGRIGESSSTRCCFDPPGRFRSSNRFQELTYTTWNLLKQQQNPRIHLAIRALILPFQIQVRLESWTGLFHPLQLLLSTSQPFAGCSRSRRLTCTGGGGGSMRSVFFVQEFPHVFVALHLTGATKAGNDNELDPIERFYWGRNFPDSLRNRRTSQSCSRGSKKTDRPSKGDPTCRRWPGVEAMSFWLLRDRSGIPKAVNGASGQKL